MRDHGLPARRGLPPLAAAGHRRPALRRPRRMLACMVIGAVLMGSAPAPAGPAGDLDLLKLVFALLSPPAAMAVAAPAPPPPAPPPPPEDDSFMYPIQGEFLSGFGHRGDGMHTGIDLRGATGDPIHASRSGVIAGQACGSGYGTCTIVDHGDGLATLYAHMSGRAVTSGPVARGQVIGFVGCTGSCETPHLHFEIRRDGVRMDPLGYL